MGLVDDQQVGGPLGQARDPVTVLQTLGREQHHLRGAVECSGLLLRQRRGRQAAVDLRASDAQRGQSFALVLHQGDQRRHDHRAPRQQGRRQLIAQRLACAGGHHRQCVKTAQHAVDDLALAGPPRAQAKAAQLTFEGALRGRTTTRHGGRTLNAEDAQPASASRAPGSTTSGGFSARGCDGRRFRRRPPRHSDSEGQSPPRRPRAGSTAFPPSRRVPPDRS